MQYGQLLSINTYTFNLAEIPYPVEFEVGVSETKIWYMKIFKITDFGLLKPFPMCITSLP